MAVIQSRSPLYPLVIILGCGTGFLVGGLAGPMLGLGGDGGLDAFRAVYGLTIGGLIAGALLEFGGPLIVAGSVVAGLFGASPIGAANGTWVDPGRLNLAGQALRGLVVLAGILAWSATIWIMTRPLAETFGAPVLVVLIGLLIVALLSLIMLSLGAAALARWLDLTAE